MRRAALVIAALAVLLVVLLPDAGEAPAPDASDSPVRTPAAGDPGALAAWYETHLGITPAPTDMDTPVVELGWSAATDPSTPANSAASWRHHIRSGPSRGFPCCWKRAQRSFGSKT